MKHFTTAIAMGAFILAAATASFAGDTKQVAQKKAAPVKLTAAQMDQVVAGRQAGTDTHYSYESGKTNYVGDNSSRNNKRAEPSDATAILDWNSN